MGPMHPDGGRWSARRTLAFVVITCGGFWGLVWLGLRAVFG